MVTFYGVCVLQEMWLHAIMFIGLLISNIDVDIIDDTFDVSISTILLYKSIDRGIDDTLLAFFIDITSILLNWHAKWCT